MNSPGKIVCLNILKKLLMINLILFVCSTPFFYATIVLRIDIYVTLRLIRFISSITIGFLFCRKREELIFARNQLSALTKICIGLVLVSIWLHSENTIHKLCFTISSTIGIHSQGSPIFLRVLWEQLFTEDIYWSILLCLTIFLFYVQYKYHRLQKCETQ